MTEKKIGAIAVYCGTGTGNDAAFIRAAHDLGQVLAENRIKGVYGGGALGLMGMFSSAMMSHDGFVTGVIPRHIEDLEQAIKSVDEYVVVDSMAQRKDSFRERADAFVILPGGCGTLDELFEELTLIQLLQHSKPVVILNINGFWDPLLEMLNRMRVHGFIRPDREFSHLFGVVSTVAEVLPKLAEITGCQVGDKVFALPTRTVA